MQAATRAILAADCFRELTIEVLWKSMGYACAKPEWLRLATECGKLYLLILGATERKMAAGDAIIIRNQKILGGTPVFPGTRVPFQTLLDYLEDGQTLDEFLDDFPTVSRGDAIAALELAGGLVASRLE